MPWGTLARISPVIGGLVGFGAVTALAGLFLSVADLELSGGTKVGLALFLGVILGLVPGIGICLLAQVFQTAKTARPLPLVNDGWTLMERSIDATLQAYDEELARIPSGIPHDQLAAIQERLRGEVRGVSYVAELGRRIEPRAAASGPTSGDALAIWSRVSSANEVYEHAADEIQAIRQAMSERNAPSDDIIAARITALEESINALNPVSGD